MLDPVSSGETWRISFGVGENFRAAMCRVGAFLGGLINWNLKLNDIGDSIDLNELFIECHFNLVRVIKTAGFRIFLPLLFNF